MAHVMSSAQIERDFSAASLVLPSNRGSMDARYFQAQLCALVNFLHLVHPEDMSPQSMSAQDVSEALPPHGFGIPDLYPDRVYDDSQDEGYDSVYCGPFFKKKKSQFLVFAPYFKKIYISKQGPPPP